MNSTYKRVFKYAKPYKLLLIFSIFSSFLYVILNSASIWMIGSLINKILIPTSDSFVLDPNIENSTNLNLKLKEITNSIIGMGSPSEQLKSICIILFFIYLFKNIFFYINNISISYIQNKMIKDIRSGMFSHITSLPISFYKKFKSSEIISILINDVGSMRLAFADTIQKLIVEPINILFFLILLIIISPMMTLITLPTIIISGIIIVQIGKSIRRKAKRSSKQIAGLMNVLNDSINGIKIVKAFNNEKFELDKFNLQNNKYFKLVFRQSKLGHLTIPINDLIGVSIGVVLLWYGGSSVLQGNSIPPGDFMRFIILLFALMQPARKLANVNTKIQLGLASAERVFMILDQPITIKNNINSEDILSLKDCIQFKNVNFKYDTKSNFKLNNINIKIKKNEKVALVGASGSGKSTLADLIPRFYDTSSGDITIDGKNIRNIKIQSLRSLMGIVTQDTILFNDTVYNNIAYGLNNISEKDVIHAAKSSNSHEFIKNLPNQYNTILSEKGQNLSGGQRQRLSIARALLKNPPIIILDEATSNLDTESENKIKKALNKLINNRTVIIIAHRLTTISQADKIIVLNDGKIIESGSHNELIKNNSEYKKLYDLQFDK